MTDDPEDTAKTRHEHPSGILYLFQHDEIPILVDALLDFPPGRQFPIKELANHAGFPRHTVAGHIDLFLNLEILTEVSQGSPQQYRVADSATVVELFHLNSALNTAGTSEVSVDHRMSSDRPWSSEDHPANPADLLPANSVLELDEYIEIYAVIGHRTRYEILYRLVHGGDRNLLDFAAELPENSKTLRDQLEQLLDAGLIQRRQRSEKGDSEVSTYYRATILGEVALTEGIDELIRSEQEFPSMYDSSVEE